MNRWADLAILALLSLALVRGIILAREAPVGPAAGIPLAQEGEAPGALAEPGAAREVVTNQMAVIGEIWTIEDLARAAQLMESGALPEVPPLSDSAAKKVRESLRLANDSRKRLTTIQAEIRTTEDELTRTAREIAASLTPEQRAWILAHRDRISVSEVEQRYWDALLGGGAL